MMFHDDNKKKVSIRRVVGTIGFLASIVAVFINVNHESLQMLMMLSASLLGITTIDKFANKKDSLS